MKLTTKIIALLLMACLMLTSCSPLVSITSDNDNLHAADETPAAQETSETPDDTTTAENELLSAPGTYNEGVVLVKCDDGSKLDEYSFASTEQLYTGSDWYICALEDGVDTAETVESLRALEMFDAVDFDYIMGVTAEVESVDVSGNPAHGKQNDTFKAHHIKEGWDYLKKNGYNPGGSSGVVVAVIDTGVDYSHLDLRNNIWVNSAEIPDNGKDDDGNGYIDDLCGWNCVSDNKDPMDDNGHGTHVAGIIAAEDNKEGGVGVAYNCKIMVLKAGNSSGYFNNSDIAEAIQYAYMNGADVINMSFGGSNISIAVEEALENAYNTSVLVAAAGNSRKCNQPGCFLHEPFRMVEVCYPAALPYVIGVMSTNKEGKRLSSFSNYDHYPYNNIEYEVYAVGEGVYSTWPGNKYVTLNGTSMAAPMVAGIAALLRSYYSDREVYSTKFIQSQIVNTVEEDKLTVNLHSALSKTPTPDVNLYDYHIDDSTSISENNNGNGVIDSGETIRLYISLHNRGGVASNVNVSIDTIRNGDVSITDPYFTFVNTTLYLSDIGTYSVRECYDDQYFEIVVSPDCPNDYLVDFNIRFTYDNGLDEKDNDSYSGDGVAQFNVSRGFHLPNTITEDTFYTADRLYIVGQDVVIPEGVTVTFEEGCEIQFYDDRTYFSTPNIIVYGTLFFNGTNTNSIEMYPSQENLTFVCSIINYGTTIVNNVNSINLIVKNNKSTAFSKITNSKLKMKTGYSQNTYCYASGSKKVAYSYWTEVNLLENDYIEVVGYSNNISSSKINNCYILFAQVAEIISKEEFSNNIVATTHCPYYSTMGDINYGGDFRQNINNNYFYDIHNLSTTEELRVWHFGNDAINNLFSLNYQRYASQLISGYYDAAGNPTVDVYGSLADASLLWPHVVSVEMFDKAGNPITTVGREEIKVRVTFNRPMDVNAGTFLTFGTIEPYGDYRIDGEYVSDTVWEGTYILKAQIENGQNFLKINNAWAAEDPTKTVFGEYQLHEFTIDTTAAMSINLQAVAKENGIELNFVQDDYDTLLGYNVYRSTEKDGNYVKLNSAILLPDELTFLDENAEPGKTYWYTYTVVLTDFTESNPAGKVQATAMDTMAPSLYHTPVNQGYVGNNLVISCTARDNVGIQSVVLYYRTVGTTEWKTLSMVKQSDKFSAKIYGNELTLEGLEYYIVAYDENNSIAKGSAETPYTVVIKDASAISRKGDVDGDGVVTTKDALMLMQCINGDLILSDDEFRRADLNGDGVLNSSEALRILQYINGKVNTLEM